MLNKAMIIGRLGRDPELKYAASGMPIANLSVATDESYVDRDGQKVERTEWHRVVVFQRQAENCSTYLSKGSLIYVEGSLQTRKWQDPQGVERYTTEIKANRVQFLDRKGAREGAADPAHQGEGGQRVTQRQQTVPATGDDLGPAFPSEASGMDDVPF
ncbi:MAG: single-stranded DNA-binding protein [Desulfovibrio sp.]|jgi:single-strand DNA-binding protein|nr:single-stranded DNA-binding protein [Desulfovibrio sp.]